MTAEEDALLDGIAAESADDVPRLVYADWLQDHDRDVFAEFIRIQCEIAKLETGPRAIIEGNVHLWKRQQELLDGYEAELLPAGFESMQSVRSKHRFHRGFLDEIDLEREEFLSIAEVLAELRPVPDRVALRCFGGLLSMVVRDSQKAFGCVTTMEVDTEPYEAGFHPLDQLMLAPRPKLRILKLRADNSALQVVASPNGFAAAFPAMTQLHWTGGEVNDVVVFALLNSGFLHQLEVINFRHNAIGDQAALELADRLSRSKKLRNLNLSNNPITRVGQSAMLAAFGSRVDLF